MTVAGRNAGGQHLPAPSSAAEAEGSCGATTAFDGAAGGVDRIARGPPSRAQVTAVPSRTASSRGPSTTWRGTTASSGPSARLTTTSCPTRQRTATTPTSWRAGTARPRRGHRRARGLRQPHACAVRRERGQRPKPPRRPGRCDSGRGEPRPGVQPARRRGEPRQVRGSRRARTGLARGAGLLRAQQLGGRGRPDPSRQGREPARVEPAGPEPGARPARRVAPGMPPDLTTGCFVVKDEVPGVAACASRVTHAALNKDRVSSTPPRGAQPARRHGPCARSPTWTRSPARGGSTSPARRSRRCSPTPTTSGCSPRDRAQRGADRQLPAGLHPPGAHRRGDHAGRGARRRLTSDHGACPVSAVPRSTTIERGPAATRSPACRLPCAVTADGSNVSISATQC